MAASWPSAKKTFTQVVNGIAKLIGLFWNTCYDEVEAMQIFIGAPGAAQSHQSDLLSVLSDNYVGGRCYKKDADEIYISPFAGIIANAAGTVKKLRVSTSVTTLAAANLDTGTFAAATYYYIYATADAAATTPAFVISASASAPTGYTHYRKVGWFYNETISILNITKEFVGNIKDGSGNPNVVKVIGASDISTNSASYVDMTDMTIPFVSNGRPILLMFAAPFRASATEYGNVIFDIDGVDTDNLGAITPYGGDITVAIQYVSVLAAGSHTFKVQWKSGYGTLYQYGAAAAQGGRRVMIAKEI